MLSVRSMFCGLLPTPLVLAWACGCKPTPARQVPDTDSTTSQAATGSADERSPAAPTARGTEPASSQHGIQTSNDVKAPASNPTERVVTFHGACDASGAVALDKTSFAVADDEDNYLRLYDAERGGDALRQLDVSPQLGLHKKHPESDFEAATRIGETAFWLTSHARNKKGKPKPERQFFFATSVPNQQDPLTFIGAPYRGLVDDLIAAPAFTDLKLKDAVLLAPKEPGGFNIEGMTATPDAKLLLGLRNPVPEGLAVLFVLQNPREVLTGAKPQFEGPLRVDLGGLGVRGLSWWHGRYLIIAGPRADGPSRLYTWQGPGQPAVALPFDVTGFNPEGFFTPEDRDDVLLLSDDGSVAIDGSECKLLEDPAHKRFRGIWIKPG